MKKSAILIVTIIITGIFYIYNTGVSYAAGPTIINTYTIDTPTTWTKANSPYEIKNFLTMNAPLIIEPGVVIKTKKGVRITIANKLTAKGTIDDKIIFTSLEDDSFMGDTNGDGDATKPAPGDWSGVSLYKSDADIENVFFLYGSANGNVEGALTVNNSDNVIIKDSEIKYSGYCGLILKDSLPVVENNIISNNTTGILVDNNSTNKSPTVSNNVISNNNLGAFVSGAYSYKLNAIDNWWGDKSGPYYDTTWTNAEKNLNGKGNAVGNGVIFNPWLSSDPLKVREPVIFVPGIAAAINPDVMFGGELSGRWIMFDHTYDGIIQAFKDMGYVENHDFFIAYYDWRNSNADSAKNYLEPIIQRANINNKTAKVNIVAHSMGGLVARSYIESDKYNNDVDNLIMLATPNKGSSDVYDAWEGGYIPKNWNNEAIMKAYLHYMNISNKTFNSYQTVHKFIPSIGELMPVYDYTYPKNTQKEVSDSLNNYSCMKETNSFLGDLNNKIELLNQRVKVSIVAGKEQPTVNAIPVVDSNDSNSDFWKDGKPDPIDPEKNDSNGDGEVMLSSAQIQNKFFDTLNYGHKEIVSQSENIIAQRLDETLEHTTDSPQINDEMVIWFASPVDVEITDPDNKKITSNSINQIPFAKYAGESNPDGFKIFSIPNPKEGKYDIKITGNSENVTDREYHIGSEYADYTGTKNDSSSLVQGEIKVGDVKQYEVAYNPLNEAPVEDILPADTTPPIITATVSPEPNVNGWNNTNVMVHFDATDEDGGSGLKSVTPDVTLSDEEKDQAVTGTAEDNAGNTSSASVNVSLDQTPPVTTAKISETKGGGEWYASSVTINFSATDNLSGVDQTFHSLDGADEQSENALTVSTDGTHQVKFYSIDKAGNKEDEKTLDINIDQTAPTVAITSPQNTTYKNSAMLPIAYSASDEQSATDGIVTKVFYDGSETAQNKIDLSLEKLGAHAVSAMATDEAGNQSAKIATNFTVTTDINAIIQNINHYFALGLIKNRLTKLALDFELKNIQASMKLLTTFNSKWLPRWMQEQMIANLKRNINGQIDILGNQLRHDKNLQKFIDSKIQTILLEDLEMIRG